MKKFLKNTAICLSLLVSTSVCAQSENRPAEPQQSWFETAKDHMKATWEDGSYGVFLPWYTQHAAWAYEVGDLHDLNNHPRGFGVTKGRYNEKGNYEGYFAFGLVDSFYHMQYGAGYQWTAMWDLGETDIKYGVGGLGMITARKDVFNYTPLPWMLPTATINYKNVSVSATYIPGWKGFGNGLFIWGGVSFD